MVARKSKYIKRGFLALLCVGKLSISQTNEMSNPPNRFGLVGFTVSVEPHFWSSEKAKEGANKLATLILGKEATARLSKTAIGCELRIQFAPSLPSTPDNSFIYVQNKAVGSLLLVRSDKGIFGFIDKLAGLPSGLGGEDALITNIVEATDGKR